MTLRHRAIFESNDGLLLKKVAVAAWRNWVLSKRQDTANPHLLEPTGEFIQLSETRRAKWEKIDDHSIDAIRITDVTNSGQGDYAVVITWVSSGARSWVQIDGIAPDAESPYKPPKISQNLFDAAAKQKIKLFDASPSIKYSPAPQVIDEDRVDELIDDVLENQERTMLALVAGTEFGARRTEWSMLLEEKIYPQVVGMTTMWLLTAEATAKYNSKVPEVYQVFPQSVHAFRPKLNLARTSDSSRHRYFTKANVFDALTNRDEKRYLQNRLYYLARSVSLGVELPHQLIQADTLFEDLAVEQAADKWFSRVRKSTRVPGTGIREALQEKRRLREAAAPDTVQPTEKADSADKSESVVQLPVRQAPKPSDLHPKKPPINPEKTRDESLSESSLKSNTPMESLDSIGAPPAATADTFVNTFEVFELLLEQSGLKNFGVDATEDGLVELFDFAEKGRDTDAQMIELRNTYRETAKREIEIKKELENYKRQFEEAEDRLLELNDVNRSLYASLRTAKAKPEDYILPITRPDSVAELLERFEDEFRHLKFTGDRKSTLELDHRPNSSTIAKRTWGALQVLEDYAAVFHEHGTVERYLRSDQSTLLFAVDHAPRESDSVASNAKFRSARELRVPKDVDPSGKIYMEAHFKITNDGGKAARLHYHDAMETHERLYIGYLGAHLPNTMTS